MKTKKELKNEYKQLKPQMGVFRVINSANQKCLLEASTNISAKWSRHQVELKFGTHRNTALQSDWNTFGSDVFSCEILAELDREEEENLNYQEEVSTLLEMVEEQLQISEELRY